MRDLPFFLIKLFLFIKNKKRIFGLKDSIAGLTCNQMFKCCTIMCILVSLYSFAYKLLGKVQEVDCFMHLFI